MLRECGVFPEEGFLSPSSNKMWQLYIKYNLVSKDNMLNNTNVSLE